MKTSDIPDTSVCLAYAKFWREKGALPPEILHQETGAPPKVCLSACERAFRRGLVAYGTSLRSGWLTELGVACLAEIPAPITGWAFVCLQTHVVLGIAEPFTSDAKAHKIQNDFARRFSTVVARRLVHPAYLSAWFGAVAKGDTPRLCNAQAILWND